MGMKIKGLPVWILVAGLVVASAGAAVGTVLSGQVQGEMPVAVSQALLSGAPQNAVVTLVEDSLVPQNVVDGCGGTFAAGVTIPPADRFIGVVSDDHTGFQAAAEIDTGDCMTINVPLKNASNQPLVGTVTLNIPAGLTAEVVHKTVGGDSITAISRTGANTWKFNLASDALYRADKDCLLIVIASADDMAPGFYNITGTLRQIAY